LLNESSSRLWHTLGHALVGQDISRDAFHFGPRIGGGHRVQSKSKVLPLPQVFDAGVLRWFQRNYGLSPLRVKDGASQPTL
jgi:hypothetical protein